MTDADALIERLRQARKVRGFCGDIRYVCRHCSLSYSSEGDAEACHLSHKSNSALISDLTQYLRTRVAALEGVLVNAPIIGPSETAAKFRLRQDAWLKDNYGAAMGDKA